jgi:hypothetical protein
MIPPAPDTSQRLEWDLLHELRDHPELLRTVAGETSNELQLQSRLRQTYPDQLVRAAFSLCELRKRAAAKFSRADQMWFDRRGLEQATAEPVARHKARRFHGPVWDLCCGIGGDTIALAEHAQVTSVDLDPAACLRTEWNAAVYGVADRVTTLCADVKSLDLGDTLFHIDPDRRQGSYGRAVRIEGYVPGLEFLQRLATTARGGAIKLSPASNFGGKFPDAEVELVSLDGECKEATIWFGELRGEAPWRATALPAGETLAGNPLDFQAPLSEPLAYLFDPDPAVVRAGLVDAAADQLYLSRLDLEEEYLTGSVAVHSPFVRPFEVLAVLPNRITDIRNYFRKSSAGQVEIKCRHIPIDVEAIRRRLPLPGTEPRVLIIARAGRKSRALVCRRVVEPS